MQWSVDSPSRPTATICLVGFLLLVGFALRSHGLGHSLWLDELHTAWTVSGSFAEVAPRARIGNQSPPFFYAEWGLARLFGLNEIALRSLSVGASTVFMALAAWALWRWTASRVATVAVVAMLAVDRLFIFYAQDARPYAILHFVALLQLISLREVLLAAQHRWRIAFVVSSIAMLSIHYTSSLLLIAEAVYVVSTWCGRGAVRRAAYRPVAAVVDAAVVALLTIPLVSHAGHVASQRANWAGFVPRPTWGDLATLFPLDVWFLYPALAAGLVSWLSPNHTAWSPGTLGQNARLVRWLLGVFFVLLVITWLLTRTDIARVFLKRYLMIGAVAPIAATAIIGVSLRGRGVVLAYFVTLALGLAIAPLQSSTHSLIRNVSLRGDISGHARENWRGAIEFIQAHDTQPAPVFVRSGFIECTDTQVADKRWLEYCTAPVNNIYDLARDGCKVIPLCSERPWQLTPYALECVTQSGSGWFILRGGASLADKTALRLVAALSNQGTWQMTSRRVFVGRPGVCVFRLQRAERTPRIDESNDL